MDVLRSIGSYLLAVLAALAIIAFSIISYINSNIINTNGYLDIVGPLPRNEQVASALASYSMDQLFDKTNAEEQLKGFLPPRLSALAPTLVNTLQVRLTDASKNIIKSDDFNQIWVDVNKAAHERLIESAKTPPEESKIGENLIKFAPAIQRIRERLGADQATLVEARSNVNDIVVNLKTKQANLHRVYTFATNSNSYLPYLFVALALAAIAVANIRSRAVVALGGLTLVGTIIGLIIIKVFSTEYLSQFSVPTYRSAAEVVYNAFYSNLQQNLVWLAIAAVIVLILGLLFSPYRWSRAIRDDLRLKEITKTEAYKQWTTGRGYVGQYKLWIWGAIFVIGFITMLVPQQLTAASAIIAISIIIALVSLIEIIAIPHRSVAPDVSLTDKPA